MKSTTLLPLSADIDPMDIRGLLIRLGVSMNYKGFEPCVYAVCLAGQDPSRLQAIFKCLYPDVVACFGMPLADVDRNLRTVVKVAWKTNPELLNTLAGRTLSRKPTASQFITLLTFHFMNGSGI